MPKSSIKAWDLTTVILSYWWKNRRLLPGSWQNLEGIYIREVTKNLWNLWRHFKIFQLMRNVGFCFKSMVEKNFEPARWSRYSRGCCTGVESCLMTGFSLRESMTKRYDPSEQSWRTWRFGRFRKTTQYLILNCLDLPGQLVEIMLDHTYVDDVIRQTNNYATQGQNLEISRSQNRKWPPKCEHVSRDEMYTFLQYIKSL